MDTFTVKLHIYLGVTIVWVLSVGRNRSQWINTAHKIWYRIYMNDLLFVNSRNLSVYSALKVEESEWKIPRKLVVCVARANLFCQQVANLRSRILPFSLEGTTWNTNGNTMEPAREYFWGKTSSFKIINTSKKIRTLPVFILLLY